MNARAARGPGEIAGVLLAGGRSLRMGGNDKALRHVAGVPLIERVVRRFAPQVSSLVISANGDPRRFEALGLPVVADQSDDFQGPLSGILAALQFVVGANLEVDRVASVSVDAPFIPLDLVARLATALDADSNARVAVAQSRGQRHHVIGLWRADAARAIADALACGERKAETLVDRLGAVEVAFDDLTVAGRAVDPFFNVNTPADLAFADELLAGTVVVPPASQRQPFVVGVAGWKNSGKTTLVARLVTDLTARGFRVSTVKHTHHDLSHDEIVSNDRATDSARHRAAGAHETALVAPRRWVLNGDVREDADPTLASIVACMAPADFVIVEGFKGTAVPKIEVRRRGQGEGAALAERDALVFAIASDHPVGGADVPLFSLDDVPGIVAALLRKAGLAGVPI